MTLSAALGGQAHPARSFDKADLTLIANAMIAFAVFLGGFVIFEPAPYELLLAALLFAWIAFGMRVPRAVMPLLVLFVLFNTGGIISSFQIADYSRGLNYMAVSFFLALSSVFFAILILEDMGRLRLIFRAYVVAAVITTILGIIGYFGVGGFEIFTRYSRAMGAFQDPNVFGPFLVAPILYLLYGIMNRSATLVPLRAGVLLILLLGVFLSFSRAAWGLTVVAAFLLYLLLIINEQRAKVRLKYILLGVAGILSVALLLAVAIQIDTVADILSQRIKVVQDYDGGRGGRFDRHWLGLLMATEKPLGIGPLEFGHILNEDTHNIYLKALMDYGWIGFTAWMTMVFWTLIGAFKLLFRPRPWQAYLQIAYVVFFCHQLVGIVIDTDHWRHHYLVIGMIWGCMALERRWQRQKQPGLLMKLRDAQTPPALRAGGQAIAATSK